CREHGIPFELCGKIVVATEEQELPILKGLFERGRQNGLDGLKMLDTAGLREYEPHVAGLAGFFVPQTGIVDYKVVAEKYAEQIRLRGGDIKLGEKVVNVEAYRNGVTVETTRSSHSARMLVNCAGLYSDK